MYILSNNLENIFVYRSNLECGEIEFTYDKENALHFIKEEYCDGYKNSLTEILGLKLDLKTLHI